MHESTVSLGQLGQTAKQFARRLLIIGENRLELLAVEVQEERVRLVRAILLALGVAAFGLLATITLTAGIVILFWACSHWIVLLVLTLLYSGAGLCLWLRLSRLIHDWQTLPATLDQLRKDRACLEKSLA